MSVLVALVLVLLGLGAFTTDRPLAQQVIGCYLFVSLAVLVAQAHVSGLRLLTGRRRTRLVVRHTAAGTDVQLGRVVRPWVGPLLVAWGAGWWAVAVYVALGGAGAPLTVVGRTVAALAAAAFGTLVAARGADRRHRRLDRIPHLLLTPEHLVLPDGELVSWVALAGVTPQRTDPGRRRPTGPAVVLSVEGRSQPTVLRMPGQPERDLLVGELRRISADAEQDPGSVAHVAGPQYADRLAALAAG